MKRKKYIIITLIIILTILIIPAGNHNKQKNTPEFHSLTTKHDPLTEFINNRADTYILVEHTTTQSTFVIFLPFTAKTISFRIYDLEHSTTYVGCVEYDDIGRIIKETILANSTTTSYPPTSDPFVKIMNNVGHLQTFTFAENGTIQNSSIALSDSIVKVYLTNTIATLTLLFTAQTEVTFTWTTIVVDWGWLKPYTYTPTTTKQAKSLPIINIPGITKILTNSILTIPVPTFLFGKIQTNYYNTVLEKTEFYGTEVVSNSTKYTIISPLIAVSLHSTTTLHWLTSNILYSLPDTLSCTQVNDEYHCTINETEIFFNDSIIGYKYTYTTKNIVFTVFAWFAYLGRNAPYTTITIKL